MERAKQIINDCVYLTIGTCDHGADGAWVAPVRYWTDAFYNLYFVSHRESKHIQHVTKDAKVAISIYEPNIAAGGGSEKGVQMEGRAALLKDPSQDHCKNESLFQGLRQRLPNTDISTKAMTNMVHEWYHHGRIICQIKILIMYINKFDGIVDVRLPVQMSKL